MPQMQTSMRTHFLMMMIGASLITMLCIGAAFFKSMYNDAETQIATFHETLVNDVERELKDRQKF